MMIPGNEERVAQANKSHENIKSYQVHNPSIEENLH